MYTQGTVRLMPDKTKAILVFIYSVTIFLGQHLMKGGDLSSFITPANLIYPEIITGLYVLLICGINTIKEINENKEFEEFQRRLEIENLEYEMNMEEVKNKRRYIND